MEQSNNKFKIKDKLFSFYSNNKLKIYLFFLIILLIFISTIFLKMSAEKKNILISEKYIQAGLYLSSNINKEKSINLYEEIIISKNKFYSILALNTILEKDLILDKSKILNYFKVVEEIKKTQEQNDILIFKKALYLKKISKNSEGDKLLKNLIDQNSKIKLLAEEILAK